MHGPAEVDVNGALPFLVGERDERFPLGDTRIADEDVDLPESLRGGGNCSIDLSRLRHVRLERFGLGPDSTNEVHRLSEVVRSDVVGRNARPSRANANAIARPMPMADPAPVRKTTFPSNRPAIP